MSKILLIMPFLLLSCKSMPQKKMEMEQVQIESVRVYKYFAERGFTTMGAFTHFDDLKKQETEQLNISSVDTEKLQQIMNDAKKMKHFQRKHPGGLIFCEMQFANPTRESRVVISIGKSDAGVMDLTARKDYVVRTPSDVQWLSEFANRLKGQ
jgi:hypothetical protein